MFRLSTKLTTTFLYLLLSTIGSNAAVRSDELFLPNPFGDQFPDVHMASEMMLLSRDIYSINSTTSPDPDRYKIIRYNDTGSTELMVVTTKASGNIPARIVVVFRGTDTTHDGDWLRDFEVAFGPFGPPEGPIVRETIYDDLGEGNGLQGFEILAHSGFNEALFSMNLYGEIKNFLLDHLQDPIFDNTVYVTGHSLGGANSQLFGTLLAYDNPGVKVILTSFASPMVGNYGFKVLADSLKNLMNWRFVNREDMIARNPITPAGYYPAGHIMWKRPGGNESVEAYYRQSGDPDQGYEPIGRIFYTCVGRNLWEDHRWRNYVEWIEYATRDMQANYTCGFQGSNLTDCIETLTTQGNNRCDPSKTDCGGEMQGGGVVLSLSCFFLVLFRYSLCAISFLVTQRKDLSSSVGSSTSYPG